MATLRIRLGMSDVILLLGPGPLARRTARRLARDTSPVPRGPSPRLVTRLDP